MISRFTLQIQEKRCEICGEKFTPIKDGQKYCNEKCRHIAWKKYMKNYMAEKRLKEKLKNIVNLDEFENLLNEHYRNSNNINIWTSEMSERMGYLLQNQQLSVNIIKDKCWVCSSKENLILHHVKYIPVTEIKILCRSCHEWLHKVLLSQKKCKPKIINN